MTDLQKGGNAPLASEAFEVSVRWKLQSTDAEIDVSAFVLEANGKVRGDEDMVFYNQTALADGSVRMSARNRPAAGGAETCFDIDLRRLRPSAERISFTAVLADAVARRQSFGSAASLLAVTVRSAGAEAISFDVPVHGMTEAALILGDVYRRNGQWKFRAVGQGFNGGLKPLAESFGVDVSDDAPPAPVTPPASVRAAPVPPPAPATVSLSKVTLTKEKPKVSLAKKGGSFGEIRINLNWNKAPNRGGFFGGGSKGIDLDLACLFELKDGTKSVVQALGNRFGSYDTAPFVSLSADDRTGESADGEWLRVNGPRWSDIKRLLVFTFIYEGVANWSQTDGVVTVHVPGHGPIEVKLDEGNSDARTCAIALLENVDGQIAVSREVKYFRSTQEIDRNYGWGLQWVAGRK